MGQCLDALKGIQASTRDVQKFLMGVQSFSLPFSFPTPFLILKTLWVLVFNHLAFHFYFPLHF